MPQISLLEIWKHITTVRYFTLLSWRVARAYASIDALLPLDRITDLQK
jgi:hypothetical protein